MKLLKTATIVSAIIGIVIIIGAAGNADYTAELHKAVSTAKLVKNLVLGSVLLVPSVIMNLLGVFE